MRYILEVPDVPGVDPDEDAYLFDKVCDAIADAIDSGIAAAQTRIREQLPEYRITLNLKD